MQDLDASREQVKPTENKSETITWWRSETGLGRFIHQTRTVHDRYCTPCSQNPTTVSNWFKRFGIVLKEAEVYHNNAV